MERLYDIFDILEILKVVCVNVQDNLNVREKSEEMILELTGFTDHSL